MRPEGIVGFRVYWGSQSERERERERESKLCSQTDFYSGALLHREYLCLIGSSLTICVSECVSECVKEK